MDRTKKNRLEWKILFVSLSCVVGASVGGYYLYLDLNEVGGSGSGKPLGKIERRESKVRRKSASNYVWTNVQVNEDLYRRDSIQTGRGSAASIRLADGNLLDVGEDSLVVIDDTTNLALSFLRGTGVVHKSDGDSKISVGKDGKAKVEELSARLIKPENLAKFFVSGKEPRKLNLSWETRSKVLAGSYTLQISASNSFNSSGTRSIVISDPKVHTFQVEVPAGKYYWRLLTQTKVLTETRQFRVLNALPLKPVWPSDPQKLTQSSPDGSVQFRWVSERTAGSDDLELSQGEHRIELATDPQIRSILQFQNINPTQGVAHLSNLPEGMIYWRIKSTYGDLVLTSGIKAFSLKLNLVKKESPLTKASSLPSPTPPPLLPPPSAVKPEPGAVLTLLRQKSTLEASWSAVNEAEAYEVTIYRQAEAKASKKLVMHQSTKNNSISLKTLPPGKYQWSIRSIDARKVPGASLPFRVFTITYGELLSPPQVVSPEVQ